MSTSGWYRVILGLQKVASTATHQTGEDVGIILSRVTQHGLQILHKALENDSRNSGYEQATESMKEDSHRHSTDVSSSSIHERASTEPPVQTADRFAPVSIHSSTQHASLPNIRVDESRIRTLDPGFGSSASVENATSSTPFPEGRPVPATRISRAMGFASLGIGLVWGAAQEGITRMVGLRLKPQPVPVITSSSSSSSSTSRSPPPLTTPHTSAPPPPTGSATSYSNSNDSFHSTGSTATTSMTTGSIIMNDANADRFASSLCRMRGAALKLGQMLSIQDESLLPPPLTRALEQVRKGANAMPHYQFEEQMISQLGSDWRRHFHTFDIRPFAAASIGQVHRATILNRFDGTVQNVVVKVQYPGVAESIESDLQNLSMLVRWTGMAPKGLFIENVLRVGQAELKVECDYRREMRNQQRIQELVEGNAYLRQNRFVVPNVIEDLTTDRIITSEYRPGGTIDQVSHLSQEERNRIGKAILYLTFQEIFSWRLMQTDPNWGNFLYDVGTRTTSLIDFGATRDYSKEFMDGYLRIVWASANRDEETLMRHSRMMHFLTGHENEEMLQAHKASGYTVGEPFWTDEPFDFRGSQISSRMSGHMAVFLRHRLTAPPEEVYTLHRKIAGAYMLNIKLGSVIRCRDILEDIVANYKFHDGLEPLAQ